MTRMQRRSFIGATAATLAVLALPGISWAGEAPAPSSPEFPAWVMNQIDDMHRGKSSHGVMSMTVKTEHWTRNLSMETWSRGQDYSLVRILAPKKEKGTATLKNGEDLFTYLAKTGRTVKISGAMMGGAWMGSHFTNNDLVKSSRLVDDYEITLSGKKTIEGVAHYVFTLMPKPDAAVVWGKIVILVRPDDLLPTREIFYDEDGEAVRQLEFKDYAEVSGRTMARSIVVRPMDGSGEYTRIVYDKIDFDVDLPTSMFTIAHLKSM